MGYLGTTDQAFGFYCIFGIIWDEFGGICLNSVCLFFH